MVCAKFWFYEKEGVSAMRRALFSYVARLCVDLAGVLSPSLGQRAILNQ